MVAHGHIAVDRNLFGVMRHPTRFLKRNVAFTAAELLVAMATSSIVLAGLFVATTSLTKTLTAIERYSRSQAAQNRLIDSVAIDLRRAVGVSITTAPGSNPSSPANTTVKFAYNPANPRLNTKTIQDGSYDPVTNLVGGKSTASTYLNLTLPGFYQSNSPASKLYREPMTLITSGNAVRYGTKAGVAADITVQYRKEYVTEFGSECYVRREAGVDRVIVEKAEAMDLDITAQANNSFVVDAWFVPTFKYSRSASTARVTSSDRVMLRNPRKD